MPGMVDRVLTSFPAHTHPLTLVSDPDDILADETIWAGLLSRGFHVVREDDPFALRVAVRRHHPWSAAEPLVVITAGPLETLPYDLWQQGRRVVLDLHQFFPNLAYPLVRQLSPAQRARLAAAVEKDGTPARMLTERETATYVLRTVFGLSLDPPPSTASLLVWLADYAASGDPMPASLADRVYDRLHGVPSLQSLPLDQWLANPATYPRDMQREWEGAVRSLPSTGSSLLPFAADTQLQDALPALVRRGVLHPVVDTGPVPEWARPAVISDGTHAGVAELNAGLAEVDRWLQIGEPRWEDWQSVARCWAEVTSRRYDPALVLTSDARVRYDELAAQLDQRFATWLRAQYTRLAGRVLPTPHELYHVPQWLASRHTQHKSGKVALLVLDGMALADWVQVRAVWQARHSYWQMHEALVLAQVPSITAVSRLALISGRPPDRFAYDELNNRHEAQWWTRFWEEQGIESSSARYERLTGTGEHPAALTSHRTKALCLVSTAIDEMVHGTTQGAAGMHAMLDVWLRDTAGEGSARVEGAIEILLGLGYAITVTSDHGHVEATGIGPLTDGVLAGTRSKRARVYSPATLAQSARARYPDTILWEPDRLLPQDTSAVMPPGRGAFVRVGDRVVSHGGITLDEMVVPLVTITKK